MKKILTIAAMLVMALVANAQTIYLCKDGSYTTQQISQGLEIDLAAGYDSITFTKPQIAPVVAIAYNGTTATAQVPSSLSGVTASVSGADVVITSTNEQEEVTYTVSGATTNGSLTINGVYKLTLALNGVDITSAKGAAIDIQCGKRVNLVVADGTVNNLSDAASGAQKACLYCKGHLELSGAGTLNVSGNKSHAIATKEYFQMKRTAGTVNIVRSANDGIHAGQYFQMNGGKVVIARTTVADGIQAELTNDATDENNGQVIIKGGVIEIEAAGEDAKCIKADGLITITGGTFTLNASGNGSRGIQTDGSLTITETDAATAITVNATGGKCTLAECADDPHKCTGIKVDGDLTVNAGTVKVYNTGKKSKAIKVGGTYTKNGGTVVGTVEY